MSSKAPTDAWLLTVMSVRINILSCVAVPNPDLDYMDQLSSENYSKHLQQDTEQAIARAVAEQQEVENSPEELLNAVCTPQMHRHIPPLGLHPDSLTTQLSPRALLVTPNCWFPALKQFADP